MPKRIGFIGVGLMGHGMCKNLLEKGYDVIGLAHRNRAPLEDLIEKGATEGANPKDVVEQSDIVIICVTGSPQVEEVVYGENGILDGCREGQIIIDCTSSEPAMTARVNGDLSAKGVGCSSPRATRRAGTSRMRTSTTRGTTMRSSGWPGRARPASRWSSGGFAWDTTVRPG